MFCYKSLDHLNAHAEYTSPYNILKRIQCLIIDHWNVQKKHTNYAPQIIILTDVVNKLNCTTDISIKLSLFIDLWNTKGSWRLFQCHRSEIFLSVPLGINSITMMEVILTFNIPGLHSVLWNDKLQQEIQDRWCSVCLGHQESRYSNAQIGSPHF